MDLHDVSALLRPSKLGTLPATQPGDAFVAGGTWLFSEPQPGVRRLVDLGRLGLSGCSAGRGGVLVGATCTLAHLEHAASRRGAKDAAPAGTVLAASVTTGSPGGGSAPAMAGSEPGGRAATGTGSAPWPEHWLSAGMVERCCRMLASAPVRALATVGGNLCLALPASPVAAMAVALDATVRLRAPDGTGRTLPVEALVLGERRTALRSGELLCALHLPSQALVHPWALRRGSLSPLGRSAVLVVGQRRGAGLVLTFAACLPRPRRLCFDHAPDDGTLPRGLDRLGDFLGGHPGTRPVGDFDGGCRDLRSGGLPDAPRSDRCDNPGACSDSTAIEGRKEQGCSLGRSCTDPADGRFGSSGGACGDPGGDADWRRALAGLFACEIRDELFACV